MLGVKHRRRWHRERLGLELSDAELKELAKWYKKGIKPESESLQPVLIKYIELLERQYSGVSIIDNNLRLMMLGLSAFQVVLAAVLLFTTDDSKFLHAGQTIVWLSLFFLYRPFNPDKPSKIISRLNARLLRKVAVMRAQLEPTASIDK